MTVDAVIWSFVWWAALVTASTWDAWLYVFGLVLEVLAAAQTARMCRR